jgi:hypothetical protein
VIVNAAVDGESDLSATVNAPTSTSPDTPAARLRHTDLSAALLLTAIGLLAVEWRHRTRRARLV